MKLLRHPVASFIIFAVIIGLVINIYTGLETNYGVVKGDTQTIDGYSGNIMDQFKHMNLISGIADLKTGLLQINPPEGFVGAGDLLGGLTAVGIGAIKTILGLVTTPFEIMGIITEYYTEVPAIITELVMIVVVYVAFILISAYLKQDV